MSERRLHPLCWKVDGFGDEDKEEDVDPWVCEQSEASRETLMKLSDCGHDIQDTNSISSHIQREIVEAAPTLGGNSRRRGSSLIELTEKDTESLTAIGIT